MTWLKRLGLLGLFALALVCAGPFVPQPAYGATLTYFFSNNATTTLASPITASSPSLQVVSGAGALFPVLATPGTAFIITLVKNGAPATKEVMVVTGHASGSDSFTGLMRGQDSTTALSWSAGDTVAMLVTALGMNSFVQGAGLQAQPGNYAVDTGSANAYRAILSPSLNVSVIGMPIRFKAAHTNTGASTFSDGITTATLAAWGQQIPAGGIAAGGIYTAIWDGFDFELNNFQPNLSGLLGQITNGQIPQSAVTQYQAALAIAFSQLTGQLQNGQVGSSLALPGSPTTTTQSITDSSTKVATTAYVNAFVNRGASLVQNGCRKNADGSWEEWGVAAYSGSGTPFTVTFPCGGFPNGPFVVNVNSTIGGNTPGIHALSATQVQFDMNGLGGTAQNFYWHAVGN